MPISLPPQCWMKDVLQIRFAFTSESRLLNETLIQGKTNPRRETTTQMKKTIAAISIAVIAGLACPVVFSAEEENEETVKMSELPAAVQTTIKDKAGSNEIKKIEKKTESGQTVYEAVVNKNGKEWSIEVNEKGKFLKQYQESKEKEEKGEKY
jgi:hypothetical protein